MTITISQLLKISIDQMFNGLDGVLQKGAAFAKEKDVEETVFLNSRLAPDMLPLASQIRIATELPARAMSRLAGADMPSFADDEETFDAFRERIKKARAHIHNLSEDKLDADEAEPITFPAGRDREMTLARRAYAKNFILPNLYFHVTTAYAILRHLGTPLGKADFMGGSGD